MDSDYFNIAGLKNFNLGLQEACGKISSICITLKSLNIMRLLSSWPQFDIVGTYIGIVMFKVINDEIAVVMISLIRSVTGFTNIRFKYHLRCSL